jgi:5-methylcytosine-specific restriction endonuclease McrBC regulatory subunit McrC
LWEEYLNTILAQQGYIHPENRKREKAIYLFEKDKYPRYPDYYNDKAVLDAKYKHLEKDNSELSRDDIHQIISYMYVLKSETGAVIFPYQDSKTGSYYEPVLIGKLKGYGGSVYKLAMKIPVSDNYSEFIEMMHVNETEFSRSLKEVELEK